MKPSRTNAGGQTALFAAERRAAPTMAEGSYSSDQPNPNLRAFVDAHLRERPYDPETDDYDVPAFHRPIETTKATAIYNMHTYWSKKPHDAIRQYVRHYTKPGDLVLDPFCGSGSTALAALMEGRKAVAIDRSPAATFITKNYCTPVDVEALREDFEELKAKVKPELDWLYETLCDRCGGRATTGYTVYSQRFRCPRCYETVALFDCIEGEGTTGDGRPKKVSLCLHCHARGQREEISTRSKALGAIPVLVSYVCESGCKPSRGERRHTDPDPKKREFFESFDLTKLREIEAKDIPHWYPQDRMMHAPEGQEDWGVLWRPYLRGITTVADFFVKRSLWALATILDNSRTLRARESLEFVFESTVLAGTKMQQYREAGGGFAKGTYYVPPIYIERELMGCFARKFVDITKGLAEVGQALRSHGLVVSTESATDLHAIRANSVDYIFTDPPYSGKVQYGEANFVWSAWLGMDTHWHGEEIIVNEARGKSEADWTELMRQAAVECWRVLKPGRWLSLCYHDTSEGTWALIQDLMAEAGFIADRTEGALYIDMEQKSWKQIVADKVNRRDLVINFRKPKEPQRVILFTGDESTFAEAARTVIRDYLAAHPGATKDRVYDDLVSHMVRSHRMEPHDFDALLAQVAEPVRAGAEAAARWYLKETETAIVDAAESGKEDGAAVKLRAFMEERQREEPEASGVHYGDLFEQFVYTIPAKEKPRRPLADWLADYFLKTDAGTWRPPESEEEERLKAEGRAAGTGRRIRRFLSYLQHGVPLPEKERPGPATLAGWLRHCRRSGLFEQGKLLWEKSAALLEGLGEEALLGAEEDYEVCARGLARALAAAPRGPRRLPRKTETARSQQEVLDI